MRLNTVLLLLTCLWLAASPPAQASSSGGEKKKGGGASFLALPALTASVVKPGGRRAVMTVEIGLDVPDQRLRERTTALTPRLRDAFIRYIMAYAATVPPGGPPDPDLISIGLQRSTDQVLGRPGARLLLGTVLIN